MINKRRERLGLALIIMLMFVFFVGHTGTSCAAADNEYRTIQNVLGTEISVPVNVEKIGCLFGPSYEKVVVLGAEDKIVFDGDFHISGWPWSNVIYKRVNEVEGIANAHSEPNIEDLVKYEPDIVFNFPNPTTTAAIEAAGMSVVPFEGTKDYDSIVKQLEVYADAIGGDAPKIAKNYSDYFYNLTDRIFEIAAEIPEEEKHSVYVANQEILLASNMTDIIEKCGGIAVSSEIAGNKVQISKEQLLEWDPEFIFVDHAGSSGNATAEEVVKEMLSEPDYQELAAVKNGNIIIVPTGVFFWDAGVQKPFLMLLIAQSLYPEKFAEFDMKSEIMDFYSEFFYYDLTNEQADMILAHLDPPTQ